MDIIEIGAGTIQAMESVAEIELRGPRIDVLDQLQADGICFVSVLVEIFVEAVVDGKSGFASRQQLGYITDFGIEKGRVVTSGVFQLTKPGCYGKVQTVLEQERSRTAPGVINRV